MAYYPFKIVILGHVWAYCIGNLWYGVTVMVQNWIQLSSQLSHAQTLLNQSECLNMAPHSTNHTTTTSHSYKLHYYYYYYYTLLCNIWHFSSYYSYLDGALIKRSTKLLNHLNCIWPLALSSATWETTSLYCFKSNDVSALRFYWLHLRLKMQTCLGRGVMGKLYVLITWCSYIGQGFFSCFSDNFSDNPQFSFATW